MTLLPCHSFHDRQWLSTVKRVRSYSLSALFLLLIVNAVNAQTSSSAVLSADKPVEKEISIGQTHSFEIRAAKDQFLHLVIDQKSADVAGELLAADGRRVSAADNPNIKRGPEQIFAILPAAGVYSLKIASKETGRYAIKIESLRLSSPQDRKRIEAEDAFIAGEGASFANDYAEAIIKYQQALGLLSGSRDTYGEAVALYGLGRSHVAVGEKDKAAEYFQRARSLFQSAGSWDEVFKDLGPLYTVMGGKQPVFDYLAGALPLVRALKNQRMEAILLSGLNKVCEDLDQREQALDYSEQSLSLLRITGKRGAEVFTLTEIGDADLTLEEKRKAVGYLSQAILLSQGASDKALEASLLAGIGYIYSTIDEHDAAVKSYRKALPLWRRLKDKNGEAYTLSFIGTTYFLLGEPLLARDHLEQALALFRESGDRRAEAYTISYLGAVESRQGDPQKAFDNYQTALTIFNETGELHGQGSALSFLAEIHWHRGDSRKALEYYEKSLAIWRNAGYREGEALALSNLGFIYESNGESEKALSLHSQALALFRLLGNQSGEAGSLYGTARVSFTRGNIDDALAKMETAVDLIESLRTRIASVDLRASYLATYQHLYNFYIDLLMEINARRPGQGFDGKALETSERARARSLLDILNDARADVSGSVDAVLIERQRALQRKISAAEKQRPRSPQAIEAREKEIRSLTNAYRELQTEIRSKNPRYAALVQPLPLNLSQIQQMLDTETVLLEYSLGPSASYLWVVSRNSLRTVRLPKKADIEVKARAFYEAAKKRAATKELQQVAGELGRMLIEPAIADLTGKRLAIVADGILGYVPFAALTTSRSDEPLIVGHEIVYLPSASTLAALRDDAASRKPAPKAVAVFADPVFDTNDTRIARETSGRPTTPVPNPPLAKATRDTGIAATLPRLPATRREAATILSLVPETERKRALDFDANIAAVTDADLSQYRIIHFATHGLLNSSHPDLSGIVLSLVDKRGAPQEGFLRLSSIYNLKLPAELIVLSACQTALGKEVKGEGLIGLTRGFMYAGTPRVVASLWAVDDQATSALMQQFYAEMLGEKKQRPAAALRNAQIAMWKNKRFSSPYFWSAFTIQGEWR